MGTSAEFWEARRKDPQPTEVRLPDEEIGAKETVYDIDDSLDVLEADLEQSGYNEEQIDRQRTERQRILEPHTAPDSVAEWMEKRPNESIPSWLARDALMGVPGLALGPEWIGAMEQQEDEGMAQWLLRVVSMGAGITPLAQEAAFRMPVPGATAPALALMYEQAKALPSTQVRTPEWYDFLSPYASTATLINQANRQLEGVPDKKRVEHLQNVMGESIKEGNWTTLGKLFLNAEPEERGFEREGWWSQSMERLEKGDDAVRVFAEGALRAGFKPKYSGLGHLKGVAEGDPYSTAALFGLWSDVIVPWETAITAPTKAVKAGLDVALRTLPLMKGTTPEKLWRAMQVFARETRKADVDIAAPEMARARSAFAAGEEVVSKLPGEIRRLMHELSDQVVPTRGRSVDALTELARRAGQPVAALGDELTLTAAKQAAKSGAKGGLAFELKQAGAPQIKGTFLKGKDEIKPGDMQVIKPGKRTGDPDIDLVNAITGASFVPARVAESLYVAQTTGLGKAPPVTQAQEALTQLIGEAYRVAYRNRLGEDRLSNIAPGVWVTKGEASRVVKPVDKDIKPLVDAMGRKAKEVDGVDIIKLTGDERKYLNGLAAKYGVRPIIDAEGNMARAAARRFRDDIVTKRAGEGAKTRYYVRRTPAMRAIGRSLLELTPQAVQNLVRKTNDTFIEWPLSFIVDLDRRRMSLPMRTELDKIYRKLTQNGADMALTLRKKIAEHKKTGNVNPVGLMKDLLDDQIDLVTKEQLSTVNAFRKANLDPEVIADRSIKATGGAKPNQFLFDFRKQYEDVVLPSLTPQERRIYTTTNDPAVIYQLAKSWSDKIEGRINHQVKVLLETLYAPITNAAKFKARVKAGVLGRAGSTSTELYGIQTSISNKINSIKAKKAREMYEDFFYKLQVPENGEWAVQKAMTDDVSDALGLGDFMSTAYKRIGAPPGHRSGQNRSYLEWWWQYMMNMRAERYTADAMRELVASEYALDVGDPVFKALTDIVAHPGSQKIEAILSGMGTAAESRALKYLERLGADEYIIKSKGLVPSELRDMIQFMKSETGMAPVIASEYRRMRDLGVMSARDMTGIKLYDNTRALMREGMTLGWWFLAKPAYFLGNLLAVPEQLLMTTGQRGLAASGRMFTNPRIVGELVKRNALGWKPRASTLSLKTKQGVWGIDDLEAAIRKYGVDRTYARSENGRSLMNDLLKENPGALQWMYNKGGALQSALRTVNDSIEYTFRTSVFVDALKRGDDAATAARLARESLYDYSTLTPAERKIARTVFTFYTFMRKNMDAFWKGFAEDPSRVLRSLRYYNAQPSLNQFNREQFANMNEQDMGRIALGEYEDKKGRKGLYMSSPQSVFDALLLSYDIANLTGVPSKMGRTTRGAGESMNELSGQMAAFIPSEPGWWLRWWAQHTDADSPGSDLEANSRWANQIPHFMMEGERGRIMRDWFPDIRWYPVETESSMVRSREDDELPGFYALESKPQMLDEDQERIKEQIRWWQNLKAVLGGGQPLRSAQKLADFMVANGVLEGGEIELKEGTGNIMDILTAVQRTPPSTKENLMRRLEERERGKDASIGEAMKRVNP